MVWIGVEEAVPTRTDGVHQRARVLAVLAAALAVLMAAYVLIGWEYEFVVQAIVCAPVVITVVPLLARRRRTFAIACRVVAAVLILLAVPFVFFDLYLYLPCAVLLLLAPAADPWQPRRSVVVCVVGVLLFASCAITWGVTMYRDWLAPPNAFIVTATATLFSQPNANQLLNYSGSGIGYGATSVSWSESSDGLPTVFVGFDDSLSTAGQQRLKDHLLGLNGVVAVRYCDRWQHECGI